MWLRMNSLMTILIIFGLVITNAQSTENILQESLDQHESSRNFGSGKYFESKKSRLARDRIEIFDTSQSQEKDDEQLSRRLLKNKKGENGAWPPFFERRLPRSPVQLTMGEKEMDHMLMMMLRNAIFQVEMEEQTLDIQEGKGQGKQEVKSQGFNQIHNGFNKPANLPPAPKVQNSFQQPKLQQFPKPQKQQLKPQAQKPQTFVGQFHQVNGKSLLNFPENDSGEGSSVPEPTPAEGEEEYDYDDDHGKQAQAPVVQPIPASRQQKQFKSQREEEERRAKQQQLQQQEFLEEQQRRAEEERRRAEEDSRKQKQEEVRQQRIREQEERRRQEAERQQLQRLQNQNNQALQLQRQQRLLEEQRRKEEEEQKRADEAVRQQQQEELRQQRVRQQEERKRQEEENLRFNDQQQQNNQVQVKQRLRTQTTTSQRPIFSPDVAFFREDFVDPNQGSFEQQQNSGVSQFDQTPVIPLQVNNQGIQRQPKAQQQQQQTQRQQQQRPKNKLKTQQASFINQQQAAQFRNQQSVTFTSQEQQATPELQSFETPNSNFVPTPAFSPPQTTAAPLLVANVKAPKQLRTQISNEITPVVRNLPNLSNIHKLRAGKAFSSQSPDIPETNFSCDAQQYAGLYADQEVDCQVFHMCQANGRSNSFLCPEGTVFDQRHLVCNWKSRVNCAEAQDFYILNKDIYT